MVSEEIRARRLSMTRIIWPASVFPSQQPYRCADGSELARVDSRRQPIRDAARRDDRPRHQVPWSDLPSAMRAGAHTDHVPDPSSRKPIGQPPMWECLEAEKACLPIEHADPENGNPCLLGSGQCHTPVSSRNSRTIVSPSWTRRGLLPALSSPNSSSPSGCERGPLRRDSWGVRSWTDCRERDQQVGCGAKLLKSAVKPRAAGNRQYSESARRIRVRI